MAAKLFAESNTRTRGPPPSSGVTTRSVRPVPDRSPAATYTPPVNDASNGEKAATWAWVAPSYTRTTPGTPGPVPTITSATPSPFTSAVATRAPIPAGTAPGMVHRTWPVFGSRTWTSPAPPSGAPAATTVAGGAWVTARAATGGGGGTAAAGTKSTSWFAAPIVTV